MRHYTEYANHKLTLKRGYHTFLVTFINACESGSSGTYSNMLIWHRSVMKSTVFYISKYLNFLTYFQLIFSNYLLFISRKVFRFQIVCIKYKIQYSKIVTLDIYISIQLEICCVKNNIYYLTQLSYFTILFLYKSYILFYINLIC